MKNINSEEYQINNSKNNSRNIWNYNVLLSEESDETTKVNILKEILDRKMLKKDTLTFYLEFLNDSNKCLYLKDAFKYFKEKGETIDIYTLFYIITNINIDIRLNVLEEYEKYFPFQRLDYSEINIISSLEEEQILPYLFKKINEGIPFDENRFNIIYMKLSTPNKKIMINEMIKRNLLDTNDFESMFDDCKFNEKIQVLDYILSLKGKEVVKYLSSFYIYELLEEVPFEKGEEILKDYYFKYYLSDNYQDNITILFYMEDKDKGIHYLNYFLDFFDKKENTNNSDVILELLDQMGYSSKGDILYEKIIRIFTEKYNVNYENTCKLINMFGYQSLLYLELNKIKQIINLPKERFDKFMTIFDISNAQMDNNTLNNICNSFLQRKFRINHSDVCEIFTKFEGIINNNSKNKKEILITKLKYLNNQINVQEYLEKNNLSIEDFAFKLIAGDKNTINLLHKMTNFYIMKSREKYIRDNLKEFIEKLNIKIKINKNIFNKEIFKYKESYEIRSLLLNIDDDNLTKEEQELLKDYTTLQKLYEFKKNPSKLDPELKKNLKIYDSLLEKIYKFEYNDAMEDISIDNLPHIYIINNINKEFVLNIISSLNSSQVIDKLLDNDELIKELKSFIDKYKILGWGKTFNPILEDTDLLINETAIASLISNFYDIESKMDKSAETLTKYIDYANCYDASSQKYVSLLGKDNFTLISNNEGKNKSNTTRQYRLERIPDLIKMMYSKDKITIPPIDKNYRVAPDKNIRVLIGNSTNMINLTYGERTGACLRIGGAFNDLFEFCLKDKNGFHIRFEDPETHKFISRVSGIRNGNTIFLNELRNSVDEKYNDEEIIDALNKACEDLVALSKDEKVPIENIVISSDYAMENYENQTIPGKLEETKNPFYGLHFNITKNGDLVVLKTINEDNSLAPYKFGSEISKTYEPIRDELVSSKNSFEAINNYNKITIIDGIMKNIPLEEITINSPSNIIYGISGEDWAVVLDAKNNVFINTVENSRQKEKQNKEITMVLEELKKEYLEIKEDNIIVRR